MSKSPDCIIIAPTRELVAQIFEEAEWLTESKVFNRLTMKYKPQ